MHESTNHHVKIRTNYPDVPELPDHHAWIYMHYIIAFLNLIHSLPSHHFWIRMSKTLLPWFWSIGNAECTGMIQPLCMNRVIPSIHGALLPFQFHGACKNICEKRIQIHMICATQLHASSSLAHTKKNKKPHKFSIYIYTNTHTHTHTHARTHIWSQVQVSA